MLYSITPKRKVKAFILIGQSNMDGGDSSGTIPSTYLGPMNTVDKSVFIYRTLNNNRIPPTPALKQILFMEFGVSNQWQTDRLTFCGPELSIGKDLAESLNEDVVIIKYSYGGSRMTDIGIMSNFGLWQWDAVNYPPITPDSNSGRGHYNILVNYFLIPAIRDFSAVGIDLDFKFLIIDQGEADMSQSAAFSDAWDTTYVDLFNKIKEVITPYNNSINNLKSCILRTGGPNYTNLTNKPYYTNLRAAQARATTTLNGVLVSKDSLTVGADGIHETRDQQCIKGSMVASAILPLL